MEENPDDQLKLIGFFPQLLLIFKHPSWCGIFFHQQWLIIMKHGQNIHLQRPEDYPIDCKFGFVSLLMGFSY